MENIIATEVFDHFEKTYLLDRIKGSMTGPVVRITESVYAGTRRGRYSVEVDAAVLRRIIQFLEAPVPPEPMSKPVRKQPFFTGEQCDAMVKNYLKGVTSAALAVQHGCKAENIEDVLRREGIEVVDQSPRSPSSWSTTRPKRLRNGVNVPKRPTTSAYEVARQQHPRAYATWSPEDDTKLDLMYRAKATVPELMNEFGRQRGAITARIKKLALADKYGY